MTFTIEIILCLIFLETTRRDPLTIIHDFSPKIIKKYQKTWIIKRTTKFIIKRILTIIIFRLIFALVMYNFNNSDNFIKGFYILTLFGLL